jgi:HTH-type transcriptional regulator/antitoxin HigA
VLVDQDPEPGTPDGDRLEFLSLLVEHYEAQEWAAFANAAGR